MNPVKVYANDRAKTRLEIYPSDSDGSRWMAVIMGGPMGNDGVVVYTDRLTPRRIIAEAVSSGCSPESFGDPSDYTLEWAGPTC